MWKLPLGLTERMPWSPARVWCGVPAQSNTMGWVKCRDPVQPAEFCVSGLVFTVTCPSLCGVCCPASKSYLFRNYLQIQKSFLDYLSCSGAWSMSWLP